MTKDQKLHPGACTCPACSPDLWAAGIKGSKPPGECNEGLDQSRGRASNAGSGSSPPTPLTSKTVSSEEQRRQAFAVFLAALDAKDIPVSMAAAFQSGWDACMRRERPAVETTCSATWQPFTDGPVVPCVLPAGHAGKHRSPEPFEHEDSLLRVTRQQMDFTTAVVREAILLALTKQQFLTMASIGWDARTQIRPEEPSACPTCDAVRKLGLTSCFEHKQPAKAPRSIPDHLKAPVKAGDQCPAIDDVHTEHQGKCVYCGAPMPQAKASEAPAHSLVAMFCGCLCSWCEKERTKLAENGSEAHNKGG